MKLGILQADIRWLLQWVRTLSLVFLSSLSTSCAQNTVSQMAPLAGAPPPSQLGDRLTERDYIPDQLDPIVGAVPKMNQGDSLSYQGYEVSREKRGTHEAEFVVITHNGREVAKFDSLLDEPTEAKFGLASLFDEPHKQLIVQQVGDRRWRCWIVSLQPELKVVYDSGKYNLVYDIRIADLDADGHAEILQNLGSFWYFNLDNVFSPRPQLAFKYDPNAGLYVPAGKESHRLLLENMDRRKILTNQVAAAKGSPLYFVHVRSAVLDIVLRYLYAGEAEQAWNYYDQTYALPDKETIKSELIKKLKDDDLYQELTSRSVGPR